MSVDRADFIRQINTEGVTVGSWTIKSHTIWGWLTALPVLLLYILIAIIPISFAIYASFHNVLLLNPQWQFVGFQNYFEIINLPTFWGSLRRGVVYMVGSTILQTIIGVWMALVINRITFGRKILSAMIFAAYLIPTIIVALLARYALDPFIGVIPPLLGQLGVWNPNDYLLGTPDLAMPIVILVSTWKFSVFITIIVVAQLRSVPAQFYESAKICGATQWEMFRDITFPRIKGAILVAVFLRSIFMFNKFDIIWQLTAGGPGDATQTLPILAYREAFIAGFFGRANAIAFVMFLFLLMGGIGYFKFFNPSQEVETEI